MTVLTTTMSDDAEVDVAREAAGRRRGSVTPISTRTSVTGAVASMSSAAATPPWLNADDGRAARHPGVGHDLDGDGCPRADATRTAVAGARRRGGRGRPGCTRERGRAGQAGERRASAARACRGRRACGWRRGAASRRRPRAARASARWARSERGRLGGPRPAGVVGRVVAVAVVVVARRLGRPRPLGRRSAASASCGRLVLGRRRPRRGVRGRGLACAACAVGGRPPSIGDVAAADREPSGPVTVGAPARRRAARPRRPRRRPSEQLAGDAGVRRRQLLDLGPDVVDGLEAEVGAEPAGQLGGDHPVGPGRARRRDLLAERR